MNKRNFNPAPIKLETFCRGVVSEVQTAFNQTEINFVYQAEQKQFSLDCSLLDRVLTNLLSNACKYSPDKSSIDFAIHSDSTKLTFTIRDRGIGIPAEDIPHLFDSFYRASNSQNHQGNISVTSEPEVGTTFIVTIPIVELQPA